jgi:hypothetical protein
LPADINHNTKESTSFVIFRSIKIATYKFCSVQ